MLNIKDETENDSVENEITKSKRSLSPNSSDNCHLHFCDDVFEDYVMAIESSKIMLKISAFKLFPQL
jgi:hypothetical protein